MVAQDDMVCIDPYSLGHLQLQGMVQLRPDPQVPLLGELDLCLVQDLRDGAIVHNGSEPGQDRDVVLDKPFQPRGSERYS